MRDPVCRLVLDRREGKLEDSFVKITRFRSGAYVEQCDDEEREIGYQEMYHMQSSMGRRRDKSEDSFVKLISYVYDYGPKIIIQLWNDRYVGIYTSMFNLISLLQ